MGAYQQFKALMFKGFIVKGQHVGVLLVTLLYPVIILMAVWWAAHLGDDVVTFWGTRLNGSDVLDIRTNRPIPEATEPNEFSILFLLYAPNYTEINAIMEYCKNLSLPYMGKYFSTRTKLTLLSQGQNQTLH